MNYSDSGLLTKKVTDQLTLIMVFKFFILNLFIYIICIYKLCFCEIDSLRSRALEKDKEIDELRRNSIAPFRR